MHFLALKWPFSSRSPPHRWKTFGCYAFPFLKMDIFFKIAPIDEKHSGAMHFLSWKWPFSSRSPPSLICYFKKNKLSIFKALIKKNTPTIRLSTGRNAFPLMKMVIFFKIAPTFYKRISFYKRIILGNTFMN